MARFLPMPFDYETLEKVEIFERGKSQNIFITIIRMKPRGHAIDVFIFFSLARNVPNIQNDVLILNFVEVLSK